MTQNDSIWNEARLQAYIDNEIEEGLNLDYKASASLDKTDKKKIEITKDVSAMANSAGGLIIYGLSEHQDEAKKHLPEKIDPTDRRTISKEWLEQIINGIQPRLSNLVIHSISLSSDSNHVAYVVEVPQSNTAHQAKDNRYYRRFNFESVPMQDYEVRDAMNRQTQASVEIEFIIERYKYDPNRNGVLALMGKSSELPMEDRARLIIMARNNGRIYANYIFVFLSVPKYIVAERSRQYLREDKNNPNYFSMTSNNQTRDRTGENTYGPARNKIILPDLAVEIERLELQINELDSLGDSVVIKWQAHVDNTPMITGEVNLSRITQITSDEVW